jgi:hypothetical protein
MEGLLGSAAFLRTSPIAVTTLRRPRAFADFKHRVDLITGAYALVAVPAVKGPSVLH